jgi:hypothetical protein
MSKMHIIIIAIIIIVGGFLFWRNSNQFDLPKGETTLLENENNKANKTLSEQTNPSKNITGENITMRVSKREILITDDVKHSIPLNEILLGGPPKDGIPSIDNPKFISTKEADKNLSNDSIGLGIIHKGEARFYPYKILVWHEIVNDTINNDPILITYCPLCATGVVFDRVVNGEEQGFGVSGKLWKSNLLMYNRTGNVESESLWSQVLGEAVHGPNTGEKLSILPSDTVKYGDWKENNPKTKVLSEDTGVIRSYGSDPYGDYYKSESVSFGVTFNDDRLHPKAFVLGIEVNGKFKAYHKDAIPKGISTDNFASAEIRLEKSDIDEVRMFIGESELPYIGGFWFSWLAVHPLTELYK